MTGGKKKRKESKRGRNEAIKRMKNKISDVRLTQAQSI